MRREILKISTPGYRGFLKDQRGVSLLEVLISTVVLGIAIAGFLMALSTATSTSSLAVEESNLVFLATQELEALRGANFEDVPFLHTGTPDSLMEIPDYFRDIGISNKFGGAVQVVSSGDLETPSKTYSRDYAFDGRKATFNEKWIGETNALAYHGDDPVGGGGDPGGGGPVGGGPGGDPGGEDTYAPEEFQYIYGAFPKTTKISRILFDNRFNETEAMGVPVGDMDYFPHFDDVWQRRFEFFWSDKVLGFGELFDPWNHELEMLKYVNDQGYGSSGTTVIYDDYRDPLELGILGVQNIDTYSDFDKDFHWPYVSEIEIYGFGEATGFVDKYPVDGGSVQMNNVIMYFPDYLGSGYDLGRRSYVEAVGDADAADISQDLITVELKFFPSTAANRDETWQRQTWWQDEGNEVARFETTFYRDVETRVDRLPNIEDYPTHIVYGDDEDLDFTVTIPGASAIRGRFGSFNLEPPAGGPIDTDDHVKIEDKDGNVYAEVNGSAIPDPNYGNWPWSPWVTGDTLVIHFVSNGSLNSYDSGFTGFAIDQIEIRWEGVDSTNP